MYFAKYSNARFFVENIIFLILQIICTRACQDDTELKRQIRLLLEDQYYVPVLRSDDNSLQPVIGEPFSPTNPLVC